MKKILYILLIGVFFSSCDFFDMDQTESPNNLKPEDANLDFVLNSMQIDLVYFLNDPDPTNWNGVNKFGMEMTRMIYMFGGTYLNAYGATDFDAVWSTAYSGFLMDANTLIPDATAKGMTEHVGMAKVMKAYILMTMVDFWGDVPYSQAFKGKDNFNPAVDDGASIYNEALTLLNEAINDLGQTPTAQVETDLFYNGDHTKWVALAKTLKLKMYLNLRLTDAGTATTQINALIADGDLIDTDIEDFTFEYSSNTDNPDSRHPYFTYNYLNGANDYMSNYYMWCMYSEKNIIDPRIRYYFYRQELTLSSNVNVLPCVNSTAPSHYPAGTVFCAVGDGYWGRDHLDNDGIPPDNGDRTVFGLYPGGGRFDANNDEEAEAGHGAQGAGMEVIMMNSYVDFMLAEAALTLGTSGNPRALLISGVTKSINRVTNYYSEYVDQNYAPSQAEIDAYITEVGNLYDAATTDAERLDVIAKEYYLALFGNGVETYNLVRRTTYPSNLQPALLASPGEFFRTIYYSSNCVNLNSSINQKTGPVQVFWDNNPAGVIK